ncbi:MAG: rane protein [Sphingobacteriaceae bacterium]|jgi:outer membrane protein OmpA-like peptidoglycan-associated protein|nr:rane protein [Sphingobacteriaceae bacterium]
MAQLDVEPKKSNSWWLWLLIALIALALLFFLARGCNDDKVALTDTDSSSTMASNADDNNGVHPMSDDWSTVDHNAGNANYDEITDRDIEVRGNDEYAVYSVDETILFDEGKSTLRPGAEDKLKQIAGSAEKRFSNGKIRIYGYTDAVGSAASNKELAEQRAEAVSNWLKSNANVAEDRLSINPVGESQPVASNATEEGRQKNRRVEIAVKK